MPRKRKGRANGYGQPELDTAGDTFPDSEDEFYVGKDRILLDEGPVTKRRRKIEQETADLQPSDEEVLGSDGISENEDEVEGLNADSDEDAQDPQSEEDDAYWGSSKADYYNSNVIETEADAQEEEAEARRLHQKQLKRMTDADFGFDELAWNEDQEVEQGKGRTVEKLPPIQIPETATDDERLTILRARYPEFEPLSEDLLELHEIYEELKQQYTKSRAVNTKIRAASAYMAAIAMYLAILTSSKDGLALPPSELRDHPIMNSLLRCRQLWDAVKDIEEQDGEERLDQAPTVRKGNLKQDAFAAKEYLPKGHMNGEEKMPKKAKKTRRLSSEELADLNDPYNISGNDVQQKPKKRKNKVEKTRPADISDLLSKAASTPVAKDDSDFGDEAPLTHEEAAEKARKKKSLRFYTSQIAQKANKRGAASRDAGGDDDLPYKERIKDKQAREAREAENRSRREPADDQPDSGSDNGLAQDMNDDANEYYNEMVSKSSRKKADKQARANAYSEAAKQGAQVYEEAQVGPDGKRRITYQIEKNKGLTPKRKKEVRNPRVKKKKKYEEKMKKLGSMRPMYKGGEGKGGYGGELTGIKTNVVKSVKL